ncbi:MAG TPA: hypothetical protein VN408_12695, partial [Actinoplanes sp.]|nr:hypothetical protein [Actinoplanes sp.]
SLLLPALDGVVHPPVVRSPHGAHTLSLDVSATLPALQPGADIAKSSFRWQPGLAQGSKVTHESRVGGGLTVVPFRWGFGAGYVQFRLFGGHYRSMISSANSSGESRIGTEFKDIPNVLIAVHMQVTITPAVREAPLSRNPFGPSGAVAPITVDLAVSGRMPATRLAALMAGTSTLVREPDGDWHVPPFAYTGGRSVTLGLSRFAGMQGDVAELIRRFEGGFLPRFTGGRTTRLYTSRAALERQNNQAELDRVLTPAGLRQGKGSTLKHGQIAELTRTKKWGTRHIVVHVTSRYLDTFTHVGTERGVAVRTARIGAGQHKVTAGRQVRSGAGVDGGAIFRFVGRAASALVPSGVLEGRLRWARRSGMQFGGQETRLHGGTPDSAAFRNRLQLIVDVYAYTRRLGHDPQARIGMGRVIRQRLPRPAPGTVARPATVSTVAAAGGQRITRYRLTDTKTVTELFDKASVLRQAVRTPPVFTARPDPLGLTRRTPVPLDTLRDWVDDPAARPVRIPDWLSIDGMPASRFVVQLAQDALRGAQQYQERQSRTKLHGQRGTDSLLDGMPLWAGTIGRLSDEAQIGALREMLAGQWFVDKLTPGEAGAATDLAVAAGLVGGEILEAYGTITTETGTTGVTEVDGVSRTEQQLVLRGNLGMNVRKTGAAVAPTSGGGALFTAGYERLLWSRTVQDGESVSAQIERIANNRKAKVRSYLVKFDLRLSVAAEVTNEPDRY